MEKRSLSNPQLNIYNTQKTYPGTAINNIGGVSLISCDEFNPEYWAKAINMYLRNNKATRMRIIEEDLEPLQYFAEHNDISFDLLDLSNISEEERQQMYSRWIREDFDPNQNQIKFKILKICNNKSGFFVVANHTISDAYTIGTMIEQINRTYINLLLNENYIEEEKPSYEIFLDREAEYATSDAFEKDRTFWSEEFLEIPSRTSISSRINLHNNIEANRYSIRINKELTKKINEFCSKNNVSIAVLFESIVFAYMSRITNETDIIIGSPSLNRVSRGERQIAGMFISTLPFKISLNDEMSFEEVFSTVSKKKKSLFKHQKFPYADIQEDIKRRLGYTGKLFDVVVSYQNAKISQNDNNIVGETHWIPTGTALNELIIHIDDRDSSNELSLNMDYQTASFSKNEVENITNRLLKIINQVIENIDIKIGNIDILTDRDKDLYQIFNYNDPLTAGKTIQEIFEEQVSLNPDKIALIFEDKTFTYQQLNAMANSLAHTIRKYNLSMDEIIPIIGERDFNIIISMLAVAKAGYSYFVIDYNEYPDGRVDTMLNDFKPKVLIKNRSNYRYNSAIEIDLLEQTSWSENYHNPSNINNVNDNLCLIHTSGSTGVPKTVIIDHKGVSNMAESLSFVIKDIDYCVSMITMSFDVFMQDVYLPLLNGNTLVLSSTSELKSISGAEKLFEKYPNSFTAMVPSRLEQFLSESQTDSWQKVKSIILGGEIIRTQLLEEIKSKMSATVYNFYGSTETTVCSCYKKLTSSDTSIGKPLPGFKIYILDKANRVLPIGSIGEITVFGDGVSKGYLNRPELNEEKFITIESEDRLKGYKSGDYGIINDNLEVEYKGRRDEQVKFNGIRIELQEIENVINNFNNIIKSATIIKNSNGKDYLCAYYVANESINENELLKYLEDKLPLYMIPQFFFKIDEMPFTTSGKLNKKLLPNLNLEKLNNLSYEEPKTDFQKAICTIWSEILTHKNIGISNTFSSLGGTSKDMIKMLLLLEKRLNIVIETKDIPKNPTILMLEEIIEGKKINTEIDENWELSNIKINTNKNANNAILLVGATGYLGSHLLYELLTSTDQEIYCLIRDKEKFDTTIKHYFGKDLNIYMHRVHIVTGDITEDNLGLSYETYIEISKSITQVYNSASNVKHYGAIEDFKNINVTGVYNLLKLCAISGAKMHHISTLSVSGQGLTKTGKIDRTFNENDLDIGQSYKDNPYVWTKFLAEKLIKEFQNIGLEANIYRVGTLDKRSYDEKFQINEDSNGFQLIVEAIKRLGVMPKMIAEMPTYIIPVDECAETVVRIAKRIPSNNTFHIFKSELRKFEEYFKALNFKYEEVDLLPFMTLVNNLIDNDSKFIIISQYLKDYMSTFTKLEIHNGKTLELLKNIDEYHGHSDGMKVYAL